MNCYYSETSWLKRLAIAGHMELIKLFPSVRKWEGVGRIVKRLNVIVQEIVIHVLISAREGRVTSMI